MVKIEMTTEQQLRAELIADIERTDWTPKDALQFYADQRNFDIVEGHARIIDNGAIASNALKHLDIDRLELKGDAELTELRAELDRQQAKIVELEAGNARLAFEIENLVNMQRDNEKIRQQIAACQEENARLKMALADTEALEAGTAETNDKLRQKLAASQLRNERLAELANECRLDLITQVHELADHIERANYCISDQDMLKQMNGQAAFAMKVSDKRNQNGNPFKALSEPHDPAALDAYVAERVKEAMNTQKEYYESVFNDGGNRIAKLTRKLDMAQEALETCTFEGFCDYDEVSKALSAIKEQP